ncbi:MAG: hypothetical protein ACLUFN_02635 [Eubacterium sp.]
MNTIKMNYKGFSFDVNPTSIKTELSKNIAKKSILFKSAKTQEVFFEPARISGSGRFVGTDARQKAHNLMRIFKSKGSAYLFAYDMPPMKAFFCNLSVSYSAKENCVSYTFSFVEDCNDKQFSYDFGCTYALEGENLYDISNRTDVAVERLFEYNNYSDLFSVRKGDRVWLC